MQTAGGEHHVIDEAWPPVAKRVDHDVAAFDPADGMFDRHPYFADDLVDGLLDGMEFAPSGLFLGLKRVAVWRFVALEAGVLEDQRIGRVGQAAFIRQLLVVDAAG